MQSYVQDLPRELRDLLRQYATSDPYIFTKLPPAVQARLIMFLPPNEILMLRKIAPEVLVQPDEFWIEKINRDFGADVQDIIDGPSDYAVYMIGGLATLICSDSGCITHKIVLHAEQTGDYEVIDRLMDVSPGNTIMIGITYLYDYLFDNYPRYRVPLTVFDLAMGRSNRHVKVTREEQERWESVLRDRRREFIRMIGNL